MLPCMNIDEKIVRIVGGVSVTVTGSTPSQRIGERATPSAPKTASHSSPRCVIS